MRRILTLTVAVLAFAPASASASGGWHVAPPAPVSVPACPAGVPVQTITVIDQSTVRAATLSRIERALVVQSRQLRDWWGTPCVVFGAHGWPIYLQSNGFNLHFAPGSTGVYKSSCDNTPTPCALVSPEWDQAGAWTAQFSHELLEMLVDPSNQGKEVCDPVEDHEYRLRGVWVEDFATPAFFTGARGPYDQMRGLVSARS